MAVKAPLLENHIDGTRMPSVSERILEIPNPATDELIARVPCSNPDEVELAISAAHHAFPKWASMPITARTHVMFRLKALLELHLDDLARSITREQGKTVEEARAEVRRGIEVVDFACGAPQLYKGETLANIAPNIDMEMHRVPLGVVAGITPFNFPVMIPLWMIPLAVVTGNTFVLKPSERTPMSSLYLVDLFEAASLPRGVLNVVHGDGKSAAPLLSDERVKAISFVGTQATAKHVYRTGTEHGKRVQALSSAKNFLLVMPDADLEQTTSSIIASAFGTAGERCLAGSVVIAIGSIGDELVARLQDAARTLVIGDGEHNPDMGPLIRNTHRDRVIEHIEQGIQDGATLAYDGRAHPMPSRGAFLGPTLFDKVQPETALIREEIFGPVLAVIRAQSLEQAILIANNSEFGNSASLYTASGWAARTFRTHIQAGMLGINVGIPAPMPFFPFSGWKSSFYGDLHTNGFDAIMFYTERKVSTVRWFQQQQQVNSATPHERGKLKS